jgi:hypothetical protein
MENHQHKIGYRIAALIAKTSGHKPATMDKDLLFNHVSHLLRKVHRKRGSYLSADDLTSLGIKVSEMDLETGRPADSGPQFCNPYPNQEFDKLFEKVSADLRLGDEEYVYSAAFEVGMLTQNCLSDLGWFNCWNPSDCKTTYRVRL